MCRVQQLPDSGRIRQQSSAHVGMKASRARQRPRRGEPKLSARKQASTRRLCLLPTSVVEERSCRTPCRCGPSTAITSTLKHISADHVGRAIKFWMASSRPVSPSPFPLASAVAPCSHLPALDSPIHLHTSRPWILQNPPPASLLRAG